MRGLGRVVAVLIAGVMALTASPAVAEPALVAGTQPSVPSDPLFKEQWALSGPTGISADKAWATSTGEAVTVAVVDSGITPHPDLNSRVLPGYDFISERRYSRDGNGRDADPSDPGDWTVSGTCPDGVRRDSSWHGTHVAGIVAAVGNNRIGISGVAPEARILPVRAVGPCGADLDDLAAAITWASGGTVAGVPANQNPARIINLSLGVTELSCPAPVQRAIDGAIARGALVLAAAGNADEPTEMSVPANCDGVVVVAATGRSGKRAPYSNSGREVNLSAPGGDRDGGIISTWNQGERQPGTPGYAFMSGTSQATAVVSGAAALIWSAYPQLTPAQVTSVLGATAKPVPGCNDCGKGRIDAQAALVAAAALASKGLLDVYTTPGQHFINGRHWRTSCEPYSQTERCRTEIWATQVRQSGGRFVQETAWVFNNLTYKASPRKLWASNPLGGFGKVGGTANWTSAGRSWRTECDTPVTGRNGCRSYVLADVVQARRTASGTSYQWVRTWVFNNMVRFG